MSFSVGDKVTWTSQSQSSWKTKSGEVVELLIAGEQPSRDRFPDLWTGAGCGGGRNHLSYVVKVGNRHYWPRVGMLKLEAHPATT